MVKCRSILNKIKVEDLDGAFDQIKICMESNEIECADVGDILRALYHFMTANENKLQSATPNIIKIISLCVDFSHERFSFTEISSNNFFNTLYHITKILLKPASYSSAITCVEHIQKLLCKSPDLLDSLKPIINNLWVSFWNESSQAEKKNAFETSFKLRCKSYELLALDDVSKVVLQLPSSLKRYLQNCKPNTASEVFEFLHTIGKQIKKSDTDSCLTLLKLLSLSVEVTIKYFKKDISACGYYLNWIADILEIKFPKNSKQRTLHICCEVLKHSLRALVLREDSLLLKTKLSQFEKLVSALKCEDEFESDLLSCTLATFHIIFIGNFESLESSEENLNRLSKAHIEFCTALSRSYLNKPSLPQHKDSYQFSLNADVAISCTLVKLYRLLIKNENSSFKKPELISLAQKFVEYAVSKLELKMSSDPSKKLHSSFVVAVGAMGFDLYYSEDYAESCFFLETSCDLMTKFQLYDLKDEDLEYDKALQTIVVALLNHNDKLIECMKLWNKVKKSAVHTSSNKINSWTISDVLAEIKADVSESTEINLLIEELKICRNEKCSMEEEIIAIIDKLSSLQCPNLLKAVYLSEVLMTPPTILEKICVRLKCSISDICLEIINLLKQHLDQSPKDNKSKLPLSVAYFRLYHSQLKLLQKFAEEEATNCQKPSTGEASDNNEETDECDIAPAFPLLNVSVEMERLRNLDHALQLWTEICCDPDLDWNTFSEEVKHWNILNLINTTAEIYATSVHDIKELKCWLLHRNISSLTGNKEKEISSSLSLVQFLLRFGYFELASELLKNVQCLFPPEDNATFSLQVLKLRFDLTTSHVSYYVGKFDEGLLLLQKIFENPLLEKYVKSTKVLQLEALLLKSKFLLVSNIAYAASENMKYLRTQTGIAASLEGAALAKGLLKNACVEDPENCQTDWMTFKMQLLKYISILFLQLGELYFQGGNVRYARCYLQEALRMSQANLLTYWTSKILLLLGEIDLLCDSVKDCTVKLYGLKYIMDEKTKENISHLLSNLKKEVSESRESTENYFLECSETLKPKRGIKQCFIDTSNVASSPMQKKKGKSLEFEVKSPTGSTKDIMSSYEIKLKIWYLNCLQLLTEGDTVVAESQLTKLLKACKHLKNLFNISETLHCGSLGISLKNLHQKAPSTPELILPVITMHQLSLLRLLKSDFEGVVSTATEALNALNTVSEKAKYFYPRIYGMLLLNRTVALLKKTLSLKGNRNVEFCSVPYIKNNIFVRKNTCLESLSVCQTPPRHIPEVVITTPKEDICKAPVKKDVLPQLMAKDLKKMESLKLTPLIFSSSDDDTFTTEVKNPRKLFNSPVKNTKNTYKLFKSKNENLSIESSCDVWKYSVSYTQKVKKKSASSKSENLKVKSQKTRMKAGGGKTESSSSKASLVRAPKKIKTQSKILKNEEFPVFEENFLSPLKEINSIEQNRSSAEKKRQTKSDSSFLCDNVFADSPEDFDRASENLEELCQSLSSVNIEKDSPTETFNKIPEEDLKNFIDGLLNIKKLIHHNMPYPLFPDVCRLLAVLNLAKEEGETNNADKLKEIGFYLSQTISTTYGQTYLNNALYPKDKCRQKDEMCNLLKVTDVPLTTQMDRYMSAIPQDWTIVQINAIPDKDWFGGAYQQPTFSKLIITQYRSKLPPLVVCVDSSSTGRLIFGLISEFEDILLQSTIIMKNTGNHKKWWLTRSSLDGRLKNLLSNMENSWLGCWKGLLLGTPLNKERSEQLSLSANRISQISKPSNERLLRVLVDSACFLNREQLTACICHLWNCSPHQEPYSKLFRAISEEIKKPTTKRNPVVLLLDKDIQALPWENVPILNGNPVTRMPSLPILSAHLSLLGEDSVFHRGLDSDKTFYILNPRGDLLYSQEMFQEKFKLQPKWKGIVAREPKSAEYLEAVKDNDLFLYIGHGSGRQYIENNPANKIEFNATTVLMGCSSGRLRQSGRRFEAEGFPLRCLLNGSPCVIGNLWDVTDKDIDRFTDKFLELFVPNYYKSNNSLTDVSNSVSQARVACKMSYLNGAAPAIYGFPIIAQR